MIGAGRVEVDGKDVRLRFVLGSDYKVTIIIETIIIFFLCPYLYYVVHYNSFYSCSWV